MKMKLTMLSLVGALALSASAQTGDALATKTAFEKAPRSNWFLTFQGGVSIMAQGNNGEAKFSDRITFTPSLSVGKWHTPYFASRLKLLGGEANTFNLDPKNGLQKHSNYFLGAHYDFMLDLVSAFSKYREDKFLTIAPYVGVGYEYKFDSSLEYADNHAATANAGLQLGFRLGKRVDLVLEGEVTANGLTVKKSNYPSDFRNTLRYTASAGLNFRLGKVGFEAVTPLDEVAVANLQSQINALRAENAELSKRPEKCPEVAMFAPVAEKSHFLAEKSILFTHGKSRVSDDQLVTLFDAAEFVKKHGGELVLTGYAQRSESRFKALSEDRAKAVAKVLTERFGVDSSKITVEYKDATEAPFDAKNAWNRVVIIRSK